MRKEDFAVYDPEGNLKGYYVTDEQLDDYSGGEHTEESREAFLKALGADDLKYLGNSEYEIIFTPPKTHTLAFIAEANGYIPVSEIQPATLQDWEDADYSIEDMGLQEVGENEDGKILYSSLHFESVTWDVAKDYTTGWYFVRWWNGNNHQTCFFEYYRVVEAEIIKKEISGPAFCFRYELIIDGESIDCVRSNMSGHISPFYYKEEEEK